MSIIDISLALDSGIPVWPGSAAFRLERTLSLERGDESNTSMMTVDLHMGTHIDAPQHCIEGADGVESLSLDMLCGPAFVADLQHAEAITPEYLEALEVSSTVKRILFKTTNSRLLLKNEFSHDYVALTADGAQWILDRNIQLVGNDYLSIAPFRDGHLIHKTLLASGVIVVEGLNLGHVQPGMYELICLPLKITGADGASARAILRSYRE